MPLFVWFNFTMQICNKMICSLTQQLISCLCLVTFLHEILGLGLCLGVWNSLFYWDLKAWKSCCTHTAVLWSFSSLIFCPSICFQKHQEFLSSSPPPLAPWWSANLGDLSAVCQLYFCRWFGFLLTHLRVVQRHCSSQPVHTHRT